MIGKMNVRRARKYKGLHILLGARLVPRRELISTDAICLEIYVVISGRRRGGLQ